MLFHDVKVLCLFDPCEYYKELPLPTPSMHAPCTFTNITKQKVELHSLLGEGGTYYQVDKNGNVSQLDSHPYCLMWRPHTFKTLVRNGV